MSEPNEKSPDPRNIFVVHGRNEKARKAMFVFLRSIGLEPIEWGEARALTSEGSPYIGSILEAAFSHAQAIVVLLTGDDIVRLREELHSDNEDSNETTERPQARPNVLFEAGLAFGRCEKRTVLVTLGPLKYFSDISGRHVVRMDDSTPKRQELASRLETAGCSVNLKGSDWHTEGDFERSVIEFEPQASSKQQQEAQTQQLPEETEAVLKVYGLEDTEALTLADFVRKLTMRQQVIRHHLDQLEQLSMITQHWSYPLGAEYWSLTHIGRSYLFEHRLL